MKTKTTCLLFAFSASLAAFGLTDIYWIGGASGDWNNAANWSSAAVPNSADCHVLVTNEVPVTISLGSSNFTIGGLSFSGANHVISGAAANLGLLVFSGGESLPDVPSIDVPGGLTATVNAMRTSWAGKIGLSKTGGGVLVVPGYCGSGGKFSVFEVAGGIVSNTYNEAGANVIDFNRAVVRSGAVMVVSGLNKVADYAIIHLEEGAIFDNNNQRDGLGGFTGQGVVTNLNAYTSSYWNGGPFDFAGRVYGFVTLAPNANQVVGDEGYLRVGAEDTLANAEIEINPVGNYTNIVRFAPGVGSFSIYQLDFKQLLPVVLEDTDGEPITLTAGFGANYKNAAFVGCGNFIKSNSNTWIITNDIYSATGMLGVKAGIIEAGTGAEGSDAALNISRLDVGSGATFKLKNFADTAWDVPVTGSGTVSPAGQGVWTLNNLSLTNGSLAAAAPATELVLAGGVATNVIYTIGPTTFKTTITGGDYAFSGIFNVSGARTVEQTGGSVRCCLQSTGSSCLNDIFYTITGGSLVSYASTASGQYPQGIGMDISGDAHVELRNATSLQHRIASGSASHTIRLSGNAYLGVDDPRIVGESASTAMGVIELNGGVMEAVEFSGPVSGSISAPAGGKIICNGGVLRAVGSANSQSWWSSSYDPNDRVKAYIGSGGAFIDVVSASFDRLLTINWPFVTGVESGTDGGFVKLGRGRLRLSRPYAGTGVFEVREGRFEVGSDMGTTPFGTAGMRIGSGEMYFYSPGSYSVAAAAGASLSYTNCATLRLAGNVALTVGPSGAAADSAVSRCGHGVLGIMPAAANATLGGNATLTVNGGMATDASTGILCQPVFERRYLSGAVNPYRMRFLTCDGNGALTPAAAVEFNPASSDSSTVAQITTAAVAVSEDTSVGALDVELSPKGVGLTIASGKTLRIGSGNAGSVAPLLLNSVNASYGANNAAGVAGGTIDFGEAEGVIVLNGHTGIWYLPTINSALAGSGGITFAAPTLFAMDTYRGMVALTKAGTYTGGTWIENAHVSARAVGCLGSGTVHVSGGDLDGGMLEIDSKYNGSTFANAIEISGRGPVYKANDTLSLGALAVRKGVTLSGGVKLVADATIATSSRGGLSAAVFSAPITGPGRLTATGTNPIRFTAANTYAGGTLITNGVVEVADGGSLGTGPVAICPNSTLRFLNTTPLVVANAISGEGRIEMNGAAVTLQNASAFSGAVVGDGSATGDDGYVKSGEGTVSFTNSLDYTGATLVEGGTLRLGQAPFDVPPAAESMAFRLDASAGDTVTEEGGVVTEWADADGRDVSFSTNGVAANGPTRTPSALADKPVMTFDGTSQRRLVAAAALPALQTVFFVNRIAAGAHPGGNWMNMGILGKYNEDFGLRFLGQTTAKVDTMFQDGLLYVDGVSNMTIGDLFDQQTVPNNKFYLLEAVAAKAVQDVRFAIGDYQGSLKRSFYGDIAEVIAYDRWLSDDERIAAERYLQSKWGLKDVSNDVFTNVLPVATALTVADGATLDLAGGYQEVASLSGAGTVANSSDVRATLVLSSGTSEFSGAFEGDVYLEVAAGATLDLCGGTIAVGGVGGSGRICNGTVVVTGEIQPGGRGAVGTLTFESAPVVAAGATLVVDGDGAGGVDKLAVEGAFDMTGLSLSVPAPKSVAPGDHVVVESGVALSGEFYATDLPDNGRWSVGYTARAAVLSRKAGLIMIMR